MENNNDFDEIKKTVSQIIYLCAEGVLSYADDESGEQCHLLWDFRGREISIGLSRDISPYYLAMNILIEKEENEECEAVITLDPYYMCLLSFEQKMVVLAHEVGHIFLNHMGSEEDTRDIEEEFEADLFAASILGKDFVLETTRSIIKLEACYRDADEEYLEEYYKREEYLSKH